MGYMKRDWELDQEAAGPEQGDYEEDWTDLYCDCHGVGCRNFMSERFGDLNTYTTTT
ncbi:hypothetical protein [Geomonas edaphica]|uniref:hypothetical protein n=1 Tax=Geomonas edaphica TaxID=2570226 RepID=UPI0013A5EECF|nr:hypothetical protein [Geomonas edaphica]